MFQEWKAVLKLSHPFRLGFLLRAHQVLGAEHRRGGHREQRHGVS